MWRNNLAFRRAEIQRQLDRALDRAALRLISGVDPAQIDASAVRALELKLAFYDNLERIAPELEGDEP